MIMAEEIDFSNLVYCSVARKDISQEEIIQIVAGARARNILLNVRGVLVFSQGRFYQWLEGDKESVDFVYNVIQHDKRHHDLRILKRNFMDVPLFKASSMIYVSADLPIGGNLEGGNFILDAELSEMLVDEENIVKVLSQFCEI
jgi:hypothetical protein